jgi:itaconate CoA-transferase
MRPLEGLLVVAVEQAVAAPYCTSRLADAGARVIKIERPEGDFARGYDDAAKGQSSYFVWLNRGKESLILDLAKEAGRAELGKLIAKADILVQNLKPGALARLGFPIDELRTRHAALICCSISGYGDEGPLSQRKAYDLLIQAESGLASITGGPEGPARVGVSIVDIATGAAAHAAILEALVGRAATGKGSDIRISMFDVMADWLTVPLLNAEAGKPPQRIGLAHPSVAPYGVFASKDGKEILISIQNEREWRSLCEAVLGDAGLAEDARFATNLARVRNRRETDGLVAKAFAAEARDILVQRLGAADIAFAEVNGMADLARHPHLRRSTIETPNGEVAYPAPAAIFDGVPRRLGAVPALGAHSESVLGGAVLGGSVLGEALEAPAARRGSG